MMGLIFFHKHWKFVGDRSIKMKGTRTHLYALNELEVFLSWGL